MNRHSLRHNLYRLSFQAQLRYELQTNKPLTPILELEAPKVPKDSKDNKVEYVDNAAVWNKVLEEETRKNGGETPKW